MEQIWNKTSPSFKAMIIGKLLGDGSITIQKGRKPRFQYTHTIQDYGWSKYCYEQLLEHIPLCPPKYKKSIDTRLKQGFSEAYYVQSKTSDIITYLRKQWYSSQGKVLPFKLMTRYFNEHSLAWWYMDDGHLKPDGRIVRKVILSTENFTSYEIDWLIEFLHNKYNLSFHRDSQNRIILYDQFQINYFHYHVEPHLHETMYRKCINSYNYNFKLAAKRTTLYLPTEIKIMSPTNEINTTLKILDELIVSYKNDTFYINYFNHLKDQDSSPTKGYQVIINENNINKLYFLNEVTGLTFSRLAGLCFQVK